MAFTGASSVAGVRADNRLPGASRSRLSPAARTVFLILALSVGIADLVVLDAVVLPRTLARKARPAPGLPAPSVAALPSPALLDPPPPPAPVAQEIPAPVEPVAAAPEAVPDLLFWRSAAALTKNDRAILESVLAVLTARPALRVRLNGHTDDIGPERVNRLLSLQRARAAQRWLVRHGVDPARIEAESFGASKPVGGAAVPSARRQSRRVEIEFR
jgi:outer membrane protein OmpA-like peptidoglycan-associated protein